MEKKKKKKTRMRVRFIMKGKKFNLQKVTTKLDVYPHKSWKKGDKINNSKEKQKTTCWIYQTKMDTDLDVCKSLNKIEKRFINKTEILCELKKQYNLKYCIEVICIIENRQTPGLFFELPFVEFVAKIGAALAVKIKIH